MTCEICILAGGLSRRMGRNKASLRFGRGTMLSHIRRAAESAGFPVRVIRRDCLPRCGPLGGVYTGLKSARAEVVLFLACDMPFVSAELVHFLIEQSQGSSKALFVRSQAGVGFPMVIRPMHLEAVAEQIKRKELSLQVLAKTIRARVVLPPRGLEGQLRNINTVRDWDEACRVWRQG